MKQLAFVAFAWLISMGAANAADPSLLQRRPTAPPWVWSGLYGGVHLGAGKGFTNFSDTLGASIYGGNVDSPLALAGVQAGYNWQVPDTAFVVGVEIDASALGANGTNTCFAPSGFVVSANCRVRQTALGSVAARLGYAAGSDFRTLFYAKGGFAAMHQDVDITTNGAFPPLERSTTDIRMGWMAGAGIERAIMPAWTFKLEYNYMDFGTAAVQTPDRFRQIIPGANFYAVIPGASSDTRQTAHAVKVGLNRRFNEDDPHAVWRTAPPDYALRGAINETAGATVEFGTRAWYSFGRHQKDLGGIDITPNLLVSRLTYKTTTASGEVFGRVDTQDGFFVKGFAGAGRTLNGKMNDEDWLIAGGTIPYSNTLSDPVKGSLAYATFDIGYSLFRGTNAKVGGFIGYNYSRDSNSAYGCAQITGSNSICVPALSAATLGITQDNHWHALRTGLTGTVSLGYGVSLTAEAAYLPYVSFSGVDNHLLRTDVADTISKERSAGQGVQLEALLSYSINPALNVGAGGRYWAAWATNDAIVNIFGTSCPCQSLPTRSERMGGFVQASYKFDGMK